MVDNCLFGISTVIDEEECNRVRDGSSFETKQNSLDGYAVPRPLFYLRQLI